MEVKELLPCPFCDGEAEICSGQEDWRPTFYDPDSGGSPMWWCECKCCASASGASHTQKGAIAAWNKRAENNKQNEYCYFCVGCKEPFRIFDEECEYCPKCGRKLE